MEEETDGKKDLRRAMHGREDMSVYKVSHFAPGEGQEAIELQVQNLLIVWTLWCPKLVTSNVPFFEWLHCDFGFGKERHSFCSKLSPQRSSMVWYHSSVKSQRMWLLLKENPCNCLVWLHLSLRLPSIGWRTIWSSWKTLGKVFYAT